MRQAAIVRDLGGRASVFALADAFSDADAHRFKDAAVMNLPIVGPRQLGYAPGLLDVLTGADLDVLHLHGLWMYPSRAATLWKRATRRGYLVSAHGMLDPTTVNRRRWKKVLGRVLYEEASWRTADRFHALTAQEAVNIRRQVGAADIRVIPNAAPRPTARATCRDGPARYLYLGRIHPHKNLAAMIDGWERADMGRDCVLDIAGFGDEVAVAELRTRVMRSGPSVRFVGPVHGDAKRDLIAASRFMVLASLGEAMPMAILEGWSAGTPAIVSLSSNLSEGIASGAAIACETDAASIARAFERSRAIGREQWQGMSQAARALAQGPYSAAMVATQWSTVYRDLSGQKEHGVGTA